MMRCSGGRSRSANAAGLLKAALPPALAAAVDWSTLRVEKGSFVDGALRSRHSDLVLSASVADEPVYFHAILEHQRDVEALMAFRMGIYMHPFKFTEDHKQAQNHVEPRA